MVDYFFRPQPAIDGNGELLTAGGSGQIFAIDDELFASPLTVTLRPAGVSSTVVPVSSIGQTGGFEVADHAEVYFKSGDFISPLVAWSSVVDASEASRQASETSATASQASAAQAEATAEEVAALRAWIEQGVTTYNWATDPAATGSGLWEAVRGGGTVTSSFPEGVVSPPPGTNLSTIFRIQPDTDVVFPDAVQHVYRAAPDGWSVPVGGSISGSIYLRSMDRDCEARVTVYNEMTGAVGTTGPWVPVPGRPDGAGWVRLGTTDVVEGQTSTGFQVRVQTRQVSGGAQILADDRFDATGVQMEQSAEISDFHYGDMVATDHVGHDWGGEPHASVSKKIDMSALFDTETTASVNWNSVLNKPSSFTPSTHTHDASSITTGVILPARLTGVVKKVNGVSPDSAGNVNVAGGGTGAVSSVAGKTGDVSLVKGDVGLGQVDNTSDLAKPVSNTTQAALNGKAPTVHTHSVDQVAGLRGELNSKRGQNDPIDAALISSGRVAPARLGSGTVADPNAFLASDGVWRTPSGGGGGGGADTNGVVVYGDSQVSNDTVYGGTKRFGELLADYTGVRVSEQGYGGSPTTGIATTAGANICDVTLQNNELPAYGMVVSTAIGGSADLYSEFGVHYGYLRGVRVRISGGSGQTRQFTRVTPGDPVFVPPGTLFVSERAAAGAGLAAVMMSGGNDPGHGVSAQQRIDAYVAVGKKFGRRFIAISSVPNDHYENGTIDSTTEAGLGAEFGDQYLNAREFLCTLGAAWANITLSGADQARASAGQIPHAFYHTDSLHFNELARSVLARRVAQMLQASGFIQLVADGGGSTDTNAPTSPTGLASSDISETSFTLTWNASTDDVGVSNYDVYLDGGFLKAVTGTSVVIDGLTPGVTHSVRVRARDAAGNSSALSSALQVTTTPSSDNVAPTAPSGIGQTGLTSSSVTLTWNASTDNVGVTGYQVSVDGVARPTIGNVLSETISGLNPETTYEMRVRARDAAGNWSPLSAALQVTTPAASGGGGEIPVSPAFWFSTESTLVGGAVQNDGTETDYVLHPTASNGTADGGANVTVQDYGGQDVLAADQARGLSIYLATGTGGGTARPGIVGALTLAAVLRAPAGGWEPSGTFLRLLETRPQGGSQWAGYVGASSEPKTSSNGDTGGELVTTWVPTAGETFCVVKTYTPGTLAVRTWVNGVEMAGSGAWTSDSLSIDTLVAYQVGTPEFIVDTRAWTQQECLDMNAYLMGKYGIA